MKKIKLSKRGIALIVAATIGTTGVLGFHISRKNRKVEQENQTGYEEVQTIANFKVNEENFVVLNVGDHENIGTHFQDSKMKYCNKKDISLGVIIDSQATNEEDIYNDVDYVKGLIRDYKVDFPVYLNIDHIITNDDLSIEMKKKIILDFLEKCTSNNICVGVSGTTQNLNRMKKYCEIKGYSAYVTDSEYEKYDGTISIYKDDEGKLKSTKDLSIDIRERDMNNSENYAYDLGHVMKEGEDILDVSLANGISVNELLRFNNLKKDKIEAKDVIRIPSVIKTTYIPLTEEGEYRGCDISYAQGDSCNWPMLEQNFDFIILRSNHGLDVDDNFETNAYNCNLHNIPMGVYCYNEYLGIDCDNDNQLFIKKQQEQADTTLSLLKNKKVEYPVYLDIECPEGLSKKVISKEQVNQMLKIWATKIQEAGYIPGIYSNQTDYEYLKSCVDYKLNDVFQVWIAGGDQFYSDETSISLEEVEPSSILKNGYVTMAQSTNSCKNAGAGNNEGHLNINFSKVDYSDQKYQDEENKDMVTISNIKEFNRYDFAPLELGALSVLSMAGVGVVAFKLNNQKTKSKKKKTK